MLKIAVNIPCILFLFSITILSQGLESNASGTKTFSFYDKQQKNQMTFTSITALDEVDGTSNDVSGQISFDFNNIASTLKGKISITTSSLRTGIDKRDKDLMESKWLDAGKYPVISYIIDSVTAVKKISENKLELDVIGTFNLHGENKEIPVQATITYLKENSMTEKREPGDLIGVSANFKIALTDFGVDNMILGTRVANNISIGVNIVGTDKF